MNRTQRILLAVAETAELLSTLLATWQVVRIEQLSRRPRTDFLSSETPPKEEMN